MGSPLCAPEGDSPQDPTASKALCSHLTQGLATASRLGSPLRHRPWQKPAAAPRAPGAAPGQDCSEGIGSCPSRGSPRVLILSPIPGGLAGTAGGQSLASHPGPGQPATARSPGGASEEPLFPPSPGETPLRSPDSRTGATAPSLPQPQRWCAHPQSGPRLWLPRAQPVLCLPGRMSPPHPRPSEPGPPRWGSSCEKVHTHTPPAHACTPWTFYPLLGSRGRLAGPSEPWARLKLQRVVGGGGRAAPGAGHRPHGPP